MISGLAASAAPGSLLEMQTKGWFSVIKSLDFSTVFDTADHVWLLKILLLWLLNRTFSHLLPPWPLVTSLSGVYLSHTEPRHFRGGGLLALKQFPSLHTLDFLGCVILCCGGCLLHCRMFGGIPDLYPPDASNNPLPHCDNQKCLQISPNVSWGWGWGWGVAYGWEPLVWK